MNVLPRPPPPLSNVVPLHSISIMRRFVVPCRPVASRLERLGQLERLEI